MSLLWGPEIDNIGGRCHLAFFSLPRTWGLEHVDRELPDSLLTSVQPGVETLLAWNAATNQWPTTQLLIQKQKLADNA